MPRYTGGSTDGSSWPLHGCPTTENCTPPELLCQRLTRCNSQASVSRNRVLPRRRDRMLTARGPKSRPMTAMERNALRPKLAGHARWATIPYARDRPVAVCPMLEVRFFGWRRCSGLTSAWTTLGIRSGSGSTASESNARFPLKGSRRPSACSRSASWRSVASRTARQSLRVLQRATQFSTAIGPTSPPLGAAVDARPIGSHSTRQPCGRAVRIPDRPTSYGHQPSQFPVLHLPRCRPLSNSPVRHAAESGSVSSSKSARDVTAVSEKSEKTPSMPSL